MSFDGQEQSQSSAQPYELYLFSTAGQNFYLTSADQQITYQGQPYVPTTLNRTESDQSSDVRSGGAQAGAPLDRE